MVKKSTCELLLQYFPKISEYKDLHSTFVANCVLNSFLCYTTIMLNIITIHAIRKTSSLPKTLKTLLLSLAASDVGVGLLAQPFYVSLLVSWIQQNHSTSACGMYKVHDILTYLFSVASFLGVLAVSVDRFLAIHLHLRYQELVTHKRVVGVVISIWVISPTSSLMTIWVPPDIRSPLLSVGTIFGLFLTIMVYIRIYLAVRRHKNQIQSQEVQQVAQSGEMSNFPNLVKSSASVFYISLVFLFCYLPMLISTAAFVIFGPSFTLRRLLLFSMTFVFLNSSLNPLIYCWKMRHIRHAIMNILRNMSWLRNAPSH